MTRSDELARLTLEASRLHRLVIVTWVAVLVAALWMLWPSKTWRGSRVEVVDAEGNVRIELAVDSAEAPGASLRMYTYGRPALMLVAPDVGGASIQVGGEHGTLLEPGRIEIGSWPDDSSRIVLDAGRTVPGTAAVEIGGASTNVVLRATENSATAILRKASSETTLEQQ